MLLLTGVAGLAQREGNVHRKGMKDFTPEQIATLQTKKMTLALDLTEAQQSQIQTLNLENAKARKAKMDELKAMKEDGERKKSTQEERFTMQNERLDRQIAQKAKFKKILSPEQYDKWQKMAHRYGRYKKGKKIEARNKYKKGRR